MMETQIYQWAGLLRVIALLGLVGVGAVGVVAFGSQTGPETAAYEEESERVAETVAAEMVLSTGKRPQVTVIENAALLAQQQPFFLNAQNGDFLLLYTQAKKAILYRPAGNQIINVGPTLVVPTGEPALP